MIVVKIEKSYRSGTRELFLIIHKREIYEGFGNEAIEYKVEERCEIDPGGHSYGYDYSWEIVNDKETIKKVLSDELKSINRKIERLNSDKKEIEETLKL